MGTTSILTGVACLGFAGTALAREPAHSMLVRSPDGTVEQITDVGAVAPRVIYRPQIMSPFAALDRIAAMMDAQMADMMREAATLSVTPASFDSGAAVCIRSVRIVSDGGRPEVTSSTTGQCGAGDGAAPASLPVRPRPPAGTILVRNQGRPDLVEVASH